MSYSHVFRMALVVILCLTAQTAWSADDFFRGKTITASTFTPPGGSYDT